MRSSLKKKLFFGFGLLVLIYGLLLIPDTTVQPLYKGGKQPFVWNKDSLWHQLETGFLAAKNTSDTTLVDSSISAHFFALNRQLLRWQQADGALDTIQTSDFLQPYFELSALVAAHPHYLPRLLELYRSARVQLKEYATRWPLQNPAVKPFLYSYLYGMRAATEEVLLQVPHQFLESVMPVETVHSACRTATVLGMQVYSGDLLVSRGGAEVSALISRGNDYPGNFSHVALVYVDEKFKPWVIEAHIEKGVAISDFETYIRDKKLRVMVMRPRADLPALLANPQFPEKAAKYVYDKTLVTHLPYDFAMNVSDTNKMFCSEVGSFAYRQANIILWQNPSTISGKGITNWLHAFGVENFVTQMPCDLEYDPQLAVVAEWRDATTLFKDHIDNAVMDVLLEEADKGKVIQYDWYLLPMARLIKGWSILQNRLGNVAKIPEGMTATQALKNQYFVDIYQRLKTAALVEIERFEQQHHYRPPYWKMLAIIRSKLTVI
jgi:hypothetical protein